MEGNFEESDEGVPATADLVVEAVELGDVGLTRQESGPLVKIVTSTQSHLDDVMKPIPALIKPALLEVIHKAPVCEVIKSPVTNNIKSSLNDMMKSPDSHVGNPLEEVAIKNEEGSEVCSSNASDPISTAVDSVPVCEHKPVTSFHLEIDWREAAQEPVLLVRCKKTTGYMLKSKFGSGSRGKCIQLGKNWYTPTEFEAHCGRSASKDWKRSIRFHGQSLLTLIEEDFLQVHATSCSCGVCLDDDIAAGSVRLHRPYKRKKRERIFLNTDLTAKVLKQTLNEESGSTTPTVTLPVTDIRELTMVPELVIGSGASTTTVNSTTTASTLQPITVASITNSPVGICNLPLSKAWEKMNEILIGLERSVSAARTLLDDLRERTQAETNELRQKLLNEKEEAVTQAKIEAQISNIAKSSEGFLVQVRDDEGNQSLQPVMLDSLISNIPPLNPAPIINGIHKKCVNCNRESDMECSGCHNKSYCSDFCQRRDWMNHQSECARSNPSPEDPLNNVPQVPGYIFMLSD